jgi:formate hydrogenlyase subunit 3/multisubunit Na+/H+ antiporter MnhD subunit
LREFPALYIAFRWLGLIMIITGGLWAIFEQKVIKMIGYGALVSSGLALLSLGIRGVSGMQLLTYSIIPRMVSLIVLSSSLVILLNKQSDTQVQDMQGYLWKTPTSTTAFLLALFSLAGVPCLPYFPLLTGLLIELTARSSGLLIPLFIGIIPFIINGYRLLNIHFRRKEDIQREGEPLAIRILLIFLISALILIGIFPSILQPLQTQLINHYPFLL